MARIVIDQEGLRGTANELRTVDQELDGVRSRVRGAAFGAMPPEVIGRIAATAAQSNPRLWAYGERLRHEADVLEWRAAAVEGACDPRAHAPLDFLDRVGMIGLGGLAGAWNAVDDKLQLVKRVNDVIDAGAKMVEGTASFIRATRRSFERLAGHIGSRASAFARLVIKHAPKIAKVARIAGKVTGPVGMVLNAYFVYQDYKEAGASTTKAVLASGVVSLTSAAGGYIGLLGLLTGPAAPVAVPLLTVGGSLAGDYVARWLLESNDDVLTGVSDAIDEFGRQLRDATGETLETLRESGLPSPLGPYPSELR